MSRHNGILPLLPFEGSKASQMTDVEAQGLMIRQAIQGTPTPDHPVPELRATIKAQMEWLKEGKKPCVFLPTGSYMPPLPQGFEGIMTAKGRFYYNPRILTKAFVLEKIKEWKIGGILGYGVEEKPPLCEIYCAVIIRSQHGTEKVAVAASRKTYPAIMEALQKLKDPTDIISFECPAKIVKQRTK